MLLSIIIPAYNPGSLIDRCLESIYYSTVTGMHGADLALNPSLQLSDFEVIVVDDGSSDGLRQRIITLQAKYANLRYHQQVNSGVSVARNEGLSLARGEYICFCDADDFLHPMALSLLLALARGGRHDIISYEYSCIDSLSVPNLEDLNALSQIAPISLTPEEYLLKINLSSGPWQFLVKRDILHKHGIRFIKDAKYFEDQAFAEELYAHVSDVLYLELPLYFYIQYADSSLHRGLRANNSRNYASSLLKVLERTKQNSQYPVYQCNSELRLIMRDKINFYALSYIIALIKADYSRKEVQMAVERLKGKGILNLGPFPTRIPWLHHRDFLTKVLYKIISTPSGIRFAHLLISVVKRFHSSI